MVDDGTEFHFYFDEIKRIWGRLRCTEKRIIPFCTPVIARPKMLVIGTNQSDRFHPQLFGENKRIADAIAREIQTEMHSYLHHIHPFAKGLAKLASNVQRHHPRFAITPQWVGTNRCAVETKTNGFEVLKKIKGYDACEREMDSLLQEFICVLQPEAVLLVGDYACGLYYDEPTIDEMAIRYLPSDKAVGDSVIIPLWPIDAKERTEHFRNKSAARVIKALNEGVITC